MKKLIFAILLLSALQAGAQPYGPTPASPAPYIVGTYSPVISATTTPPTGATYSAQVGYYMVNGPFVTVSGLISVTGLGTSAVGVLTVSLPCTSNATANLTSIGNLQPNNAVLALDALYFSFSGTVFNNSNVMQVREVGSSIQQGVAYGNLSTGVLRFSVVYPYASCP